MLWRNQTETWSVQLIYQRKQLQSRTHVLKTPLTSWSDPLCAQTALLFMSVSDSYKHPGAGSTWNDLGSNIHKRKTNQVYANMENKFYKKDIYPFIMQGDVVEEWFVPLPYSKKSTVWIPGRLLVFLYGDWRVSSGTLVSTCAKTWKMRSVVHHRFEWESEWLNQLHENMTEPEHVSTRETDKYAGHGITF